TASELLSCFPNVLLSGLIHQYAADVPISRVEQLHQSLSKTSRALVSLSSCVSPPGSSAMLVANAGNGKRIGIGAGISGWSSTMVPGRNREARSLTSAVRNLYSLASLASNRPTTLIAAFRVTEASTSLAACCAPSNMTPKLRPLEAMSTSTSLIVLDPSLVAYLLSSSRSTNLNGSRPFPCFSSKILLSNAPTTNRWASSWSEWISTTVMGSSSLTSS